MRQFSRVPKIYVLEHKNSAEVNITPAFGEITTKSVEREIKVKGTRSRCLLEECVKEITMQGFILTANTAAKK